jgi:hypothetical protein
MDSSFGFGIPRRSRQLLLHCLLSPVPGVRTACILQAFAEITARHPGEGRGPVLITMREAHTFLILDSGFAGVAKRKERIPPSSRLNRGKEKAAREVIPGGRNYS